MFDAEKAPVERSRGALGFAAVLLLVLVVLVLAGRHEIARSWGLTGEQGELVVDGCSRDVVGEDEQRATCHGEFRPDDGGEPYVVEARLAAGAGDVVTVGADGPDEAAYRSDVWGRWAAVSLPLLPLAFLWLLPWARRMLRGQGRASRCEVLTFLGAGVAPFVVLLLAGVVGFLVSLATT
ncbi:hypothetical protein [Nocardioides sp.]|uniref:hypothetical protein n=1 Tax=Nocardioides sp. TaxID=35761 RepID=UPI002715CFCA|nr:hypothetical protein [Nocardioides sp.]MDO9458346.1 hypothetical protein [Nocardioides sp.]